MADFIFNIALGRTIEFYNRVYSGDPANSALVLVVINTSEGDAVLRDLDDLAAVLANANTAEVTNVGYARKVLTSADLAAPAPDDANDQYDVDIPDQTFTAVEAGDNWTDTILCYDPDNTVGTDADLIPVTQYDWTITPDGSDVVLEVDPAGIFGAAQGA